MNQDQINQQLQDIYNRLLGRPVDESGQQSYGGALKSGQMTVPGVINSITSSPEYQNRQQQRAAAQFAPDLANLDTTLNLGKQQIGLNRAQANSNYDLSASQAGSSYDAILGQLQDQAKQTQSSVENAQNRLGILNSGLTGDALQTAARDSNRVINSTLQQKAIQLGQLAAQKANTLGQADIQEQGLTQANTTARNQIGKQTQDLVNTLIGNDISNTTQQQQNAFQQAIGLGQFSRSIPSGQSVDLGQFGKINGTLTNADPLLSAIQGNPYLLSSLTSSPEGQAVLRAILQAYGFNVVD